MDRQRKIRFYDGIIEHGDNLFIIAGSTDYSVIDKRGNLYSYYNSQWHKTQVPQGFIFRDAKTKVKYRIDKHSVSSSHSCSTTDSHHCNTDVLFTVSVYNGSPTSTGTIISGPIDMKKGDELNFWSTGGILNTVTEGSVDIQNEITNQIILPRAPKSID